MAELTGIREGKSKFKLPDLEPKELVKLAKFVATSLTQSALDFALSYEIVDLLLQRLAGTIIMLSF